MDYLLVNTELREINKTLDKIFTEINKKIKPIDSSLILEIGIGNGNKSIPISQKYKFLKYYGIEPLEKIYNAFIENNNKYNSDIISYNMDLIKFVNYIDEKFDIILLINVIHFIGFDNLIVQIKDIIKQNTIIIIQNPLPKPTGWGNKKFVKDSNEYDEKKWLNFKSKLDDCYSKILNSKYFYKIKYDDKYYFFIIKII